MTDNRMALLEMAEKAGETDFLRDLIREVVQELMEAEVDSRCGAGRHERSEARTDQRNGYRARQWDTRVGSLELSIPRLRHASYLPSFLEPRRATEQALTAVVAEAYIQGVSTRSVDALVQAAGIVVAGLATVRVDRRAGADVPGAPDRGALVVPAAGRDLCEGARRRLRGDRGLACAPSAATR